MNNQPKNGIGLGLILAGMLLGSVQARDIVVDRNHPNASDDNPGSEREPLATISKAAAMAVVGDTVRVKEGIYRESVRLTHDGAPGSPITILADPIGSVTVTGADLIRNWEPVGGGRSIYRVAWSHRFVINNRPDGSPIEHHPASAPVWGRAEQVIMDGYLLAPVGDLEALQEAGEEMSRDERRDSAYGETVPDPDDRRTWRGAFFADTINGYLYVGLADGSDPNDHKMEASVRGLLMGTNPWMDKDGVANVHVCGFVFRYGASFAQRPAVWLYGSNNRLDQCIVEAMAGGGAMVHGVMADCVLRHNGHIGGGPQGDGFLGERCLWEANSWKPIDRGWEAGGFKLSHVNGGVFRDCVFYRNGGTGLWLDIDPHNVLITHCAFIENEQSGLFIEISREVTVVRNLFLRNGIGVVGEKGGWSDAGLKIAESIDCVVAFNTCVGNKDGISFREQGPRLIDGIPFFNRGHTITGNVCAFNEGYQLGLWYDDAYFGWHPSQRDDYPSLEAFDATMAADQPERIHDPMQQGQVLDRNLYFSTAESAPFLYGVPWRPRHRKFLTLVQYREFTHFGTQSEFADPCFVNADGDDYRFRDGSPARECRAGWYGVPADLKQWIARLSNVRK